VFGKVRFTFGVIPFKPHGRSVHTECMYVKADRIVPGVLIGRGRGYICSAFAIMVDEQAGAFYFFRFGLGLTTCAHLTGGVRDRALRWHACICPHILSTLATILNCPLPPSAKAILSD
jgi:hypothetical protein